MTATYTLPPVQLELDPVAPFLSDLYCAEEDPIPKEKAQASKAAKPSEATHLPDAGREPRSSSTSGSSSPTTASSSISSPIHSLAADPEFAKRAEHLRGLFGKDDLMEDLQAKLAPSYTRDQPIALVVQDVVLDKNGMAHYKECRYIYALQGNKVGSRNAEEAVELDDDSIVTVDELCFLPKCPHCIPVKYEGLSLRLSGELSSALRTSYIQYESFMRVAAMEMAFYKKELEELREEVNTNCIKKRKLRR